MSNKQNDLFLEAAEQYLAEHPDELKQDDLINMAWELTKPKPLSYKNSLDDEMANYRIDQSILDDQQRETKKSY